MENALAYGSYAAAGAVALAVYYAMPKGERASRPLPAALLLAIALGAVVLLLTRFGGNTAEDVLFYAMGALALVGGVRVVTHRRPVMSALYFLLVVFSTAVLAFMAGAQFLGVALVMVYAGAILVTYVFVMFLAQQASSGGGGIAAVLNYDSNAREPGFAVIASFVLAATVLGVVTRPAFPWNAPVRDADVMKATMAKAASEATESQPGQAPTYNENVLAIGETLYREDGFIISVQLAGVLLMVAMVGAIALAKKTLPRPRHDEELPPPGEIGRKAAPY